MAWDSKVHNLLGACTSSSAFGEEITHLPKVGAPQTLQGIWSDVYASADPETGLSVMSSEPNVGVRLVDFIRKPEQGDIIVRRGERYSIRVPQPDGEGGATLVLEKVKRC